MDTRPVLAVALAVLFVTAGCQAPVTPQQSPADVAATTPADTDEPSDSSATTGTAASDAADSTTATDTATTTESTTTTDATDSGDATESTEYLSVNDELAFEVAPIYERVGRMLDVTESDWPFTTVRVKDPPESGTTTRASTSGFTEYVGIEPLPASGEGGGVQTGAYARGTSVTLFDHENASETFQRHVLAHEFVHVFQFEAGFDGLQPEADVDDLDLRRARPFLKTAMTEGSAEYVQERYRFRYQNASLNQTRLGDDWKAAPAYVRHRIAPYEYGSRYFAMRVQNTSGVTDVYDDPPRTAEQVIHGYDPDEERALPLTVDATDGETGFESTGAVTKGELFVRLALSSELDWERAADASTGWGMDRLQYFAGGSGTDGYAWTLRWDDANEAAEFTESFRTYDSRNDAAFRVETVTDETVVVFAGPETFVEGASATGNSSAVTIHA